MNSNKLCLCGSGLDYADCCGVYHSGAKIAATAEALMRSRFAAYAMANTAYIQQTWHGSTRPTEEKLNFGGAAIEWRKLEIIQVKKGTVGDTKGTVEFKAYYQQNDAENVLHEASRFTKNNGRWFYVDGVVKTAGQIIKQNNEGKNAPCPCGSGKKYKRCCGAG